MDSSENEILIPEEVIVTKIYLLREQKVMIDRDLAELYGVETKYLKRQVRRNIVRFPSDFMFEMTEKEFYNWRSQFVTSNQDKMGLRYAPMVFTEDGVGQLSTVLNSERAILVNIQIIRLFNKMRKILLTNKDILLKLEKLEQQVMQNTDDVRLVFEAIKKMLQPVPKEDRKPIGYKISEKDK